MTTEKNVLLGVLGGLGPMSTIYFCELLNRHTKAACDADHIDMIISSRATTPDRTAYILGRSTADPLPVMIEEANRLERAGAELIVIPCNTAHYFYDGLSKECRVPILNIIRETVDHLKALGVSRFGLLATDGTVYSGAYERLCSPEGLTCITPTMEEQATVSSIIYDSIKQNKPVDMSAFLTICEHLQERGCERLVLGCTELSLLKKDLPKSPLFTDSLEVLAYRTILACKKPPVGFSADFLGGN
ncbi:MAG: aspartate/glutamate racemase family protein [Ruminococcaceae bacterium]|nr:aspartate/glutamate racemase family protein [Oscillospiraceae bacterium]